MITIYLLNFISILTSIRQNDSINSLYEVLYKTLISYNTRKKSNLPGNRITSYFFFAFTPVYTAILVTSKKVTIVFSSSVLPYSFPCMLVNTTL